MTLLPEIQRLRERNVGYPADLPLMMSIINQLVELCERQDAGLGHAKYMINVRENTGFIDKLRTEYRRIICGTDKHQT